MPLTKDEVNELSVSLGTGDERVIAAAVFGVDSLLREVITLLASHPDKLQNMGGPIKAIEHSQPLVVDENLDTADMQVFNVEVSAESHEESHTQVDNSEANEVDSQQQQQQQGIHWPQSSAVASDNLHMLESKGLEESNHTVEDTTLFACPHCDKEFLRVFELQRHMAVKHSTDKKYRCEVCGMRFAIKLYLNNHIRIKHQPDREKPYGCSHCNYRCITKSMLTRHNEKHIAEKKYKCRQCPLSFYTARHLERHSYRHKEKDLSCDHCQFRTADPSRLKSHLKTHTSTDVFTCDQCEFTCNVKSELNKHALTHSEETFPCPECHLVFKRQYNLRRHMYVHSERNLLCDQCDWRTADPYEFKRHQKQHEQGKKHVCDKCGFAFIRQYDLRKHMKTHDKVYECHLCHHTFLTSHELSCHKRRRHSRLSGSLAKPDDEEIPETSCDTYASSADSPVVAHSMLASEDHQTVIIDGSGEEIVLPPGVQLVNPDGTPFTGDTVAAVEHQLLEMASVIIAQVDDGEADLTVTSSGQ